MDAALLPGRLPASLARLGYATITVIGPASVRDRLGQPLSEAEADALAADVDRLAVVLASGRG